MRTLALLLTILALPAHAASFCENMVMPAGALGSISRGFTSYHSGIDLAAPLGSTIRAAAAGTVVYAGWYAGYGNMVDIRHADGLLTRYAHMSAYAPELGYGTPVAYTAASTGNTMNVVPYEHTVIVIGYGPGTVTILDGGTGTVYARSQAQFMASWGALGDMAVIQ